MFKNAGVLVEKYVYDFAVDGGAVSTISLSSKDGAKLLPDEAIVKTVIAKVVTTCTSGGSATCEWGNTADDNGYSGATVAVATLAAGYVTQGYANAGALIWDDTNDEQVLYLADAATKRDFVFKIATAALTAGKIEFYVEYILASSNS